MKKQTYIVKLLNSDGTTKNFYRFSCKTIKPILSLFGNAIKNDDFFLWSWKRDNVKQVVCYATPDGYHETEAIFNYSLDDFINIANANK